MNPFKLYLVSDPAPEYMQLEYDGIEGKHCLEFSRDEVEDLKEVIRTWEAQFYE